MSTFLWILLLIVCFVIWLIVKLLKWVFRTTKKAFTENQSSQHRQRTTQHDECPPCSFTNGITRELFEDIVLDQAKRITKKRLCSVTVDGSDVYGVVRSQSGISDWNFRLDFNDFGQITGKYWTHADNLDSNIPNSLGNSISSEIHNRI